MKLRTAIKVCQYVYGWPKGKLRRRYRPATIREAVAVARHHELDNRLPHVPNEQEIEERRQFFSDTFDRIFREVYGT